MPKGPIDPDLLARRRAARKRTARARAAAGIPDRPTGRPPKPSPADPPNIAMLDDPPAAPAPAPDPLDLDADDAPADQPTPAPAAAPLQQQSGTPSPPPPAPPPPLQQQPIAPQQQPQEYDGSTPLQGRQEVVALMVGRQGMTQLDAYVATAKKKVNRDNARTSASSFCCNPKVKLRIAWLRNQAQKGAETPIAAPPPPDTLGNQPEKQPEKAAKSQQGKDPQDITQDEVARIITATLRNKPSAAEVASLTGALLKIRPQLGQDQTRTRPDPAAVVAYLAGFAGMTGRQIVRELGGPRLLVTRLCEAIDISPTELRDMAQSVVSQR